MSISFAEFLECFSDGLECFEIGFYFWNNARIMSTAPASLNAEKRLREINKGMIFRGFSGKIATLLPHFRDIKSLGHS